MILPTAFVGADLRVRPRSPTRSRPFAMPRRADTEVRPYRSPGNTLSPTFCLVPPPELGQPLQVSRDLALLRRVARDEPRAVGELRRQEAVFDEPARHVVRVLVA